MKIRVAVRPNAKIEKVEKIFDDEYNISVKEPAKGGKANRKLVNILAKKLKVNAKNIKIKNPTSRKKLIEIKEI